MGAVGDLADPLLDELRCALGCEVAFVRPPAPLPGGHSAELFAFEIDRPPRELVLRLLVDAAAAAREARIQSHVAALGYPAPQIVCAAGADSSFGRPYLVLERVPGRTPLDAAGALGVPKLFRELPGTLAQLMTELHALPVGGLSEDGTAAALADVAPGSTRDWLTSHATAPDGAVVVHGDLHGNNLLVAKGKVTAVLDWELASVAPPEYDVARTMCILALLPGIGRAARRILSRAGTRSAERFSRAYAAQRELDHTRLRWYDVLHAARLLTVARRSGSVAEVWRPLVPALERRIADRVNG